MASLKLHIGAGRVSIEGWLNIDRRRGPGIDCVADVTWGLPVRSVDLIYAEHFLEHLTLAEGLRFLRECRVVLHPGGALRLSTPNLDWIWLTHYRDPATLGPEEKLRGCLEMNRAFHGWGHRFLYNDATLRQALVAAGFERVEYFAYGQSLDPELRDLEQHDRGADLPGYPHVIIAEARGVIPVTTRFEETAAEYLSDFGIE